MIAFKRLRDDYTDRRLREAGFRVVYYDQIQWQNNTDTPTLDGEPITDDKWYFRAIGREYDLVEMLLDYANRMGIWYMDDYLIENGPRNRDKWSHHLALKDHVNRPETWRYDSLDDIHPEYGVEFVLKFNHGGRKGMGTFLIRDPEDVVSVREELSGRDKFKGKKTDWLWEEYIPNSGDYRAMIVDGVCLGMYKRKPKKNRLVMSASNGKPKRFKNNRFPSDVADQAIKAAQVLGITVCGIDLVRDPDGKVWVIDVNEAPAFEVFERVVRVDVAGAVAMALRRRGE